MLTASVRITPIDTYFGVIETAGVSGTMAGTGVSIYLNSFDAFFMLIRVIPYVGQ